MKTLDLIEARWLDDFVARQRQSPFLQSWAWGEFQARVGRFVHRVGVEDDGHLIASTQLLDHRLPFGFRYLYCPRGPVVSEAMPVGRAEAAVRAIVEAVIRKAESVSATFLRLEPGFEATSGSAQLFQGFMLQHPAIPVPAVQPADSHLLNLAPAETDLLAGMHEKTRYNIRLAERKGVRVRLANDRIDDFLRLNRETTVRDRFHSHPDSYYRVMLDVLAPASVMELLVAEFEEKVIAANLVVRFGDAVTYLHGASSDADRNVMAPHLLQWEAIRRAKAAGAKWYDFWGISDANPQWEGITRFKRGFGGEDVRYVGTFDIPIQPSRYRLYRFLKRFV